MVLKILSENSLIFVAKSVVYIKEEG